MLSGCLNQASASTPLPATTAGETGTWTTGANPAYLLDAITTLIADEVTLHLTAPDRPMILTDAGVRLIVVENEAMASMVSALTSTVPELESLQDRLYVLRSAVEVLEGAVQDAELAVAPPQPRRRPRPRHGDDRTQGRSPRRPTSVTSPMCLPPTCRRDNGSWCRWRGCWPASPRRSSSP